MCNKKILIPGIGLTPEEVRRLTDQSKLAGNLANQDGATPIPRKRRSGRAKKKEQNAETKRAVHLSWVHLSKGFTLIVKSDTYFYNSPDYKEAVDVPAGEYVAELVFLPRPDLLSRGEYAHFAQIRLNNGSSIPLFRLIDNIDHMKGFFSIVPL